MSEKMRKSEREAIETLKRQWMASIVPYLELIEQLQKKLALCVEALSAIEDGLRRIPADSHANCAASYRVAAKTLAKLRGLGAGSLTEEK